MISYIIGWIVMLAFFNIICFVTPDQIGGINKYGGAFWSGYIFITISFVIHLIFNLIMLSARNKEQRIMNTPLIVVSFAELIVMVIAGVTCMIIPEFPNWIGIIICYTILVISIAVILSVKSVGEYSKVANDELNGKTFEFRVLIDDAQFLVQRAGTVELKNIAESIYEAIRYSDLISSPELYDDEQDIKSMLHDLSAIIADERKAEEVKIKAQDMLLAISNRNNRCKTLKRRK